MFVFVNQKESFSGEQEFFFFEKSLTLDIKRNHIN